MHQRTMSVAGSFYPGSGSEIERLIGHFNAILDDHPEVRDRFDKLRGNAFIVPHAGWVYSGFTANVAYRILARSAPSSVVVIGPSHRVGFEGVSIADAVSFQTPLGDLAVDTGLVRDLMSRFSLPCLPQAHQEHSTEVQAPFLKHYCPDTRIVELVYSHASPEQIRAIIDYLLDRENTGVVISTDLSHYYSLSEATALDAICLDAIRSENPQALHQGCEACGRIGVEAMLLAARTHQMDAVLLDYRTSADASGDTARVVGYASALFTPNITLGDLK